MIDIQLRSTSTCGALEETGVRILNRSINAMVAVNRSILEFYITNVTFALLFNSRLH